MRKEKITREELGHEEKKKKTRGDQTRRCKTRRDQKKNGFSEILRNIYFC